MTYGIYNMIAQSCNCSPDYVKKVLERSRTPKTQRAIKAQAILEKYAAYNQIFNNNNNAIKAQTL